MRYCENYVGMDKMTSYLYCRNGFQKLEKIKDTSRQGRQLEELTAKMRDCKR